MNYLSKEKSPYLRQHAGNPVDWYPWSEEAFKKAKKEDKPIFLSIGYSTCHWCHVMAEESFEDRNIAELLNKTFICIKVDREERPDIDKIYMDFCNLMTGRGGWPLSIMMTPDKKPFFAGTYIPPEDRHGMIGLPELINRIGELWQNRKEELVSSADKMIELLREDTACVARKTDTTVNEILKIAYEELLVRFDNEHGGFGGAPKFPTAHRLTYLLRYWKRTNKSMALKMVETTLQKMRMGGIFDHIGFGFHRYSTDENWIVPHFEKMLYDQATIAIAYLETFQATGEKKYADVAEEIFEYILQNLRSKEGAFFSSEDADSEGEEGKFYLWNMAEIQDILDKVEFESLTKISSLKRDGNFNDPVTGKKNGNNIIYFERNREELAKNLDMTIEDFNLLFQKIRKKMLATRDSRVRPQRDDKIMADWNGLMIAAFAIGGRILGNSRYKEAARNAADFMLSRMITEEGLLLHKYIDGEAAIPAFLDDHAFLVWGLLELYQSDFDIDILKSAISLNRSMISNFHDDKTAGFFFTSEKSEKQILRSKEFYDGANPSGNSVALKNIFVISRLTGDSGLEKLGWRMIKGISATVLSSPTSYTQMLSAIDYAVGPSTEVAIAGRSDAEETKKMMGEINAKFLPNTICMLLESDDSTISEIAPFTKDMNMKDGKTTAYVCRQQSCQMPTTSADEMLLQISKG